MTKFTNLNTNVPSFKELDFSRSANLFGERYILDASLERMRDAMYIPRLTDPLALGTEIKSFFSFFTQMQVLRKANLKGKNQWLQVLVDSEPQEFENDYLQVLFNMAGATHWEGAVGPFLTVELTYDYHRYDPESDDLSGYFTKLNDHILQNDLLGLTPSSYKGGGFSGRLANPRFVEKIEIDDKETLFPKEFFEGVLEFDSDFDATLRHMLDLFMAPYELESRDEFHNFVWDYRSPNEYENLCVEYEIPFTADMIINYNGYAHHIKDMPFVLSFEHNLDIEESQYDLFDPFDSTNLYVGVKYASEELALGLICKALFHNQ